MVTKTYVGLKENGRRLYFQIKYLK